MEIQHKQPLDQNPLLLREATGAGNATPNPEVMEAILRRERAVDALVRDSDRQASLRRHVAQTMRYADSVKRARGIEDPQPDMPDDKV